MTPTILFYILVGVIFINFMVNKLLSLLNSKHFHDTIPEELADVYDKSDYKKSQEYKKSTANFVATTQLFSFVGTLGFLCFNGFQYVDKIARSMSANSIIVALIFFGIVMGISELIYTPFSYYKTFILEEKYGFNKTSIATFFKDKVKNLLLTAMLGGSILALIVWCYEFLGVHFWIYAWMGISAVTICINMCYSKLIVPLFNKQELLEEGLLKNAIQEYATTVGFQLNAIFVIDGSKRSTKGNAYFSGFGKQKQITLYDTLINDLETDEIIAVLAHEVGHYKHKHIVFNLVSSIFFTGITLFVLSLCVGLPLFSAALGVASPSFHIGLIAFGILYAPISEITKLGMNILSRKFEYQADNYAKKTFAAAPLITALKKIARKSFSNLTPHFAYVYVHYSHPTLLQRVQNLKK